MLRKSSQYFLEPKPVSTCLLSHFQDASFRRYNFCVYFAMTCCARTARSIEETRNKTLQSVARQLTVCTVYLRLMVTGCNKTRVLGFSSVSDTSLMLLFLERALSQLTSIYIHNPAQQHPLTLIHSSLLTNLRASVDISGKTSVQRTRATARVTTG